MQPIFQAILHNDLPVFLGLVEERESSLEEINEEDGLNNTVLHMAAKLGRRELVSKIIELRPSLVISRNAFGNTPLHLAALLGHVNIVMQMLETGLEVCSARNNNNQTPLHLACRSNSMEAAILIVEKTQSICLDELKFAVSSGSTYIAGIILERSPELAKEDAWVVKDGSLSTLLHHACDRGDLELTSMLFGLDQRLEKALNANGLTPLHLAVLKGSVVILEEFLENVPLSFSSLTPSKETVFHLAARNNNLDAFVFMAESLGINSQILLQQTDENGNTVLHIAASVACDTRVQLLRYIVATTMVDIRHKNKMGLEAFQALPQEAQNFEFDTSSFPSSSWLLRCGSKATLKELYSENNEAHEGSFRSFHTSSQGSLECLVKSSHGDEVIPLPRLIETNTSEIAERKKIKEQEVERGRQRLEYGMHIEALQNARNTIAIVAVLIASVAYAGGINPPGGVYQEGPWRGKSVVGKTTAFN